MPLLDVYAASYGDVGSYDLKEVQNPRHAAAIALGKACFAILSNRSQHAKSQLNKAKGLIKSIPPSRGRSAQELKDLRNITTLLSLRNQPAAIGRVRTEMQQMTIDNIVSLMSQRPDKNSEAKGRLNEATTLALLNRYNHPWAMALPALHFQDGRKGAENCDGVLVESLPDASIAYGYQYQVKSQCLGFCGKELDDVQQEQVTKTFDRYSSQICLVSGCCDLGVDITRGRNDKNFPVVTLLRKEAQDRASIDEIAQLDYYTNSLLLAITGDESRRGRAVLPEA